MSSIKSGITIARDAWVKELLNLKRWLSRYARRYYGSEVEDAIITRANNALDIIRYSKERLLSVSVRGSNVLMIIASTRSIEEGFERIVKDKTLEGYIVEKSVGAPPEEAYHIVQVGPYAMKCTCKDALITSIKADREFITGLRGLIKRFELSTPIFTKYVICKHTLTALSYALAVRAVSMESRILKETLKLGIKALVLRIKGHEALSRKTIVNTYKTLLKLSKGLPP